MTKARIKTRACPFCDSENLTVVTDLTSGVYVKCKDCHAQGPWISRKEYGASLMEDGPLDEETLERGRKMATLAWCGVWAHE